MSTKRTRTIAILCAIPVFVAGIVFWFECGRRPDIAGTEVMCVMKRLPGNDTVKGLVCGYNYHVIKKLAKEIGVNVTIIPYNDSLIFPDFIKNGNADMAVLPDSEEFIADSIIVMNEEDCASLWVFPKNHKRLSKAFAAKMERYRRSSDFRADKQLFLKNYNPFKDAASGEKPRYLSPYDSLFRVYADSTKLDWRFLAAISYQESRFRIEATSRRGAYGIMQLMPATAARMNLSNPMDPEESISSAASYLQILYGRYRRAANEEERLKFTLAGYNAGEGRIKQFTSIADTLEVDRTHWNNVSALFDKFGEFKGVETRSYVDNVMATYKVMCRITEP